MSGLSPCKHKVMLKNNLRSITQTQLAHVTPSAPLSMTEPKNVAQKTSSVAVVPIRNSVEISVAADSVSAVIFTESHC
jgi:hypothetical protein